MLYDRDKQRYLIEESSYELTKYYVLSYSEDNLHKGIGNHLNVVLYTTVKLSEGTAFSGRGRRGIDIDAKELIALRNLVYLNCANPFDC